MDCCAIQVIDSISMSYIPLGLLLGLLLEFSFAGQ